MGKKDQQVTENRSWNAISRSILSVRPQITFHAAHAEFQIW